MRCGVLQRGRQMLARLNAAMKEKQDLEALLQQQDATTTQLAMTRQQLAEAGTAYSQMHAQCLSLRAQAEDLVAHAASLRKVRSVCRSPGSAWYTFVWSDNVCATRRGSASLNV